MADRDQPTAGVALKPDAPLPFRPRDWVDRGDGHVAQVKRVYRNQGEVLLDLVIYDRSGERVGRESPAMGGPRTFEPCCPAEHYQRITKPRFPLVPRWVPNGDGSATMRVVGGNPLPPANWTPPRRKGGSGTRPADDRLRRALKAIADGQNDARGLAMETLGLKGRINDDH